METTQTLDFEEFKKAITPQHIFTFHIIYIALLLGTSLFLGMLLFAAYSNRHSYDYADSGRLLSLLTIIHVIMAIPAYVLSFIIYQYLTNPKNLNKGPVSIQTFTSEQRYLQKIFSAHIIRAAFFEGVAFFGMVICFVGAADGVIQLEHVYWLNLFSYVALAVLIVWTFPSRSRLEEIFKKRCVPKPPHVC